MHRRAEHKAKDAVARRAGRRFRRGHLLQLPSRHAHGTPDAVLLCAGRNTHCHTVNNAKCRDKRDDFPRSRRGMHLRQDIRPFFCVRVAAVAERAGCAKLYSNAARILASRTAYKLDAVLDVTASPCQSAECLLVAEYEHTAGKDAVTGKGAATPYARNRQRTVWQVNFIPRQCKADAVR